MLKNSLLHGSWLGIGFLIPDFPIPDSCSVFRRPGGHSEEPLPDPIPNSAVKVLCADGTKPQGLEE
jgi:hypothetical protein